jgi:hypothetical protein
MLERAPCIVLRAPITWRFVDAAGKRTDVAPRACFAVNDPRARSMLLGLALASCWPLARPSPPLSGNWFGSRRSSEILFLWISSSCTPRDVFSRCVYG